MRIDITVAKNRPLPAGALDALSAELSRRIAHDFPEGEPLSVTGGCKTSRDRITDLLQETWESADDWFTHD